MTDLYRGEVELELRQLARAWARELNHVTPRQIVDTMIRHQVPMRSAAAGRTNVHKLDVFEFCKWRQLPAPSWWRDEAGLYTALDLLSGGKLFPPAAAGASTPEPAQPPRRGRRPDKREAVKAQMRQMDRTALDNMEEKQMEETFDAGRTLCREARRSVLSEK